MACDPQTLVTDSACSICAFGDIFKGSELALLCQYVNNGGSSGGRSILGEGTGENILGEGGESILEE